MEDLNKSTHLRFGLRFKLLLLSAFLFTIPLLGYQYVWEMESYLRIGQEKTLMGTVSAVATALHERPLLFDKQASFLPDVEPGRDLYAYTIVDPIRLDGQLDDWRDQHHALDYGANHILLGKAHYLPDTLSFTHQLGKYRQYLYAYFAVKDDDVVYRPHNSLKVDQNDLIQIAFVTPAGDFRRYLIANKAPGWVTPYELKTDIDSNEPLAPETRIQGMWQQTAQGYTVELRIPLALLGSQLSFAVSDYDTQRIDKITIGTSGFTEQNQLGTILVPSPEIEQIIKGLGHSQSRIWVVDQHHRLLAESGDINRSDGLWSKMVKKDQTVYWYTPITQPLSALYNYILTKPPTDFTDAMQDAARIQGSHIEKALQGQAATTWRLTTDNKAVILSAAYPIYSEGRVMGVVVAEETTNGIRSLRNQALEKLFNVMLAVMLLGTLSLFLFASRISSRIRQLRNQTEKAIDDQGRVINTIEASRASDEIGDLARTFADMVNRLGQYTEYLQGMSARLSHELRTPVAVVKSSLESLALDCQQSAQSVYMARAKDGVNRLSSILTLMSEATRLEQSLENADKSLYPINQVVSGCMQGYQLTHPKQSFNVSVTTDNDIFIFGVAEFAAQLLDKLIANAIEFSSPDSRISVTLSVQQQTVILTVENLGPQLPEAMQQRLFDSMVSVRTSAQQSTPHLGLGLYIARLIAQFHQGTISIANNTDQSGVIAKVSLPITSRL